MSFFSDLGIKIEKGTRPADPGTICKRCGHEICPHCLSWCDSFFPDDDGGDEYGYKCCGGKCVVVPMGTARGIIAVCPTCRGPLLLEDFGGPCPHCDSELAKFTDPNFQAGNWIKVVDGWIPLAEGRPLDRVEAQARSFGCETGCKGYQVFLIQGGKEVQRLGEDFYFGSISQAEVERLAAAYKLPIVVEKELAW